MNSPPDSRVFSTVQLHGLAPWRRPARVAGNLSGRPTRVVGCIGRCHKTVKGTGGGLGESEIGSYPGALVDIHTCPSEAID
eukprot:2580117-Pyramimonas_sp.AAC.2